MTQHEQMGDDAEDQITVENNNEPMTDLEAARAAASSSRRTVDTPPAAIDAKTSFTSISPGTPLAVGIEIKDTPFHPSPTLDERTITLMPDYEEFKGYLEPARYALSVAVEGLKGIDAAWQALRKDISKTDAQKAMSIEPAAAKKHDQMYRTFVKANEDLAKAVQMMEHELNAPIVNAATASSTNPELREVLRKMKPEERNALIDRAVREGDATVVNAVLGVHPLTTEVDPLRHQAWTRQVHEQRNPATVRRLAATRAAIAHLQKAAPIALGQVEKAMRAKFVDVAKVRVFAEASEKAIAAVIEHRKGSA